MPWKTQDDGTIAMENGNPIFVHSDGKEVPFDAESAIKRITALNEESKGHRLKAKELGDKLSMFSAITDPEEAVKALETVRNLDAKKLVDAGQIDILKNEMSRTFTEKESALTRQWIQKEQEYQAQLQKKDESVYSLMLNGKFASSPLITEKTNLVPDIAANYFGKNFKVEGEGTDVKIVGYLNGERIPSRSKFGEPADFEEALSVIIEAYPFKDRILTSGSVGGSGSQGNKQQSQSVTKKIISNDDVKGFTDNLAAIAKGEVVVQ